MDLAELVVEVQVRVVVLWAAMVEVICSEAPCFPHQQNPQCFYRDVKVHT